MKRLVSLLLVLVAIAMLWANAATAADYIEDVTLDDLNGPQIMSAYREGIITGVFMTITASKAVSCPMMSAEMLRAGLDAALAAKEISGLWTVYHASLYVLIRAGCTATTDAVKESPNA